MPTPPRKASVRPAPFRLPLFAEEALLVRAAPEKYLQRFYRLAVWPDLFGRAGLMCHWGRLGTAGCRRIDPHPDAGAALNALAHLARRKRRCGYQDHIA